MILEELEPIFLHQILEIPFQRCLYQTEGKGSQNQVNDQKYNQESNSYRAPSRVARHFGFKPNRCCKTKLDVPPVTRVF